MPSNEAPQFGEVGKADGIADDVLKNMKRLLEEVVPRIQHGEAHAKSFVWAQAIKRAVGRGECDDGLESSKVELYGSRSRRPVKVGVIEHRARIRFELPLVILSGGENVAEAAQNAGDLLSVVAMDEEIEIELKAQVVIVPVVRKAGVPLLYGERGARVLDGRGDGAEVLEHFIRAVTVIVEIALQTKADGLR